MQFITLAVAFAFYTGVIWTASATAPDKDDPSGSSQASMGRGNVQSTGQGLPPPMAGANPASLAQPQATSNGHMGVPEGLNSATLNGSSSNHGGLPGAGQMPTGSMSPGAPMFGVPNGSGASAPNKGGLPGGSTPFPAGTSANHMPTVPGSLYGPHEGGPGYPPSGNPLLNNPYSSTSYGAGSPYPSSFGGQSGDFYSPQSGYSSPWTMPQSSYGTSLGMSGSPWRGSSSFPNSNPQSDSFNWNGFLPDGSHTSESLAPGASAFAQAKPSAHGQSQTLNYAQNYPRPAPGYTSQFSPWNRQNGGSTQSLGTQGGYYGQDGNGMPAFSQLSQGGYNGGSNQPFTNQGGYYGRGGNGMFGPSQFNQFSQTQGNNQNGGSMSSFAYPGGSYGQGGNGFSASGQYGRDNYVSQSNPYGYSGSYGYDGSVCDSGFGGQVFRGQSVGASRGWY
ncbi:hypothetical protein PGTUg99_017916 [Puccinia graminis f. sp. tritici]|uniref:Uncharacterized protein n=1 Tax=Puccinia graminis f. sp. tritici TaxID=56615 RepID=A0A5B0R790_PUCGR|nr:hypothetical protein PGTUg99_017916 [Puccinia graminis f. sp. tritici]